MTAEIAVLNPEAVALAADSASTVSTAVGPKIFNSVDKIFPLSRHAPVAAMVYGAGDLLGLPWATVIGAFRKHVSDKEFSTIDEWQDELVGFIEGHRMMFPLAAQREFAQDTIKGYFEYILDSVLADIKEAFENNGPVTTGQIKQIVKSVIATHHAEWKAAEACDGGLAGKETAVQKAHTELVSEERRRVFAKSPISSATARQLGQIATWLFTKNPPGSRRHPRMAGLVLAGYGSDEYFPRLRALEIDAIVLDRLKFRANHRVDIQRTNSRSVIVPFAQKEMIISFMEGSHPDYSDVVRGLMVDAVHDYPERVIEDTPGLSKTTKAKIAKSFADHASGQIDDMAHALIAESDRGHIDPILDAVAVLPKDDLAAMAESLVSLTSFRRKVTFGAETVGGPIDVAVISKSDGFIWISRKHYFDRDKNPHHLEAKGRI